MDITREKILEDIKDLKSRLATARKRLKELPVGYIPYPAHKQREKQRYRLLDEIEHLKNIIKIAREGLESDKPVKEKTTPPPSPKQIPLF